MFERVIEFDKPIVAVRHVECGHLFIITDWVNVTEVPYNGRVARVIVCPGCGRTEDPK